MRIEERIEWLERENEECKKRIEYLEKLKNDKFVTPQELAKTLNCSAQNIYNRIRSGDIQTVRGIGNCYRIPMSQFYTFKQRPHSEIETRVREFKEISDLKDIVFGTGQEER